MWPVVGSPRRTWYPCVPFVLCNAGLRVNQRDHQRSQEQKYSIRISGRSFPFCLYHELLLYHWDGWGSSVPQGWLWHTRCMHNICQGILVVTGRRHWTPKSTRYHGLQLPEHLRVYIILRSLYEFFSGCTYRNPCISYSTRNPVRVANVSPVFLRSNTIRHARKNVQRVPSASSHFPKRKSVYT